MSSHPETTYVFAKANRDYRAGEEVARIRRRTIWLNPNRIQKSRFRFYKPPESYLHGCYEKANIRIDLETMQVLAKTDIVKDQILRYDYSTTEWRYKGWRFEFDCNCGSIRCRRHIKGAKYLSNEELREIIESGDASAYIQKKAARRMR